MSNANDKNPQTREDEFDGVTIGNNGDCNIGYDGTSLNLKNTDANGDVNILSADGSILEIVGGVSADIELRANGNGGVGLMSGNLGGGNGAISFFTLGRVVADAGTQVQFVSPLLVMDCAGVDFGALGDEYTGVIQDNGDRNVQCARLYSQTNGILCLDAQSGYVRVNYTCSTAVVGANVVQFPVQSWEATDAQTQQLPFVCDLFITFANDGDAMNVEAVDNPINQAQVANSMTFKGIDNGGGQHAIPLNGVGGLLGGVNDMGGLGRGNLNLVSNNGNADQKLHLRISSYGNQLGVAQELLVEVVGLGPDGTGGGATSVILATPA